MHVKEGDVMEIKGPFPKFNYVPNMRREIGMIAGGTGITPMLQVSFHCYPFLSLLLILYTFER